MIIMKSNVFVFQTTLDTFGFCLEIFHDEQRAAKCFPNHFPTITFKFIFFWPFSSWRLFSYSYIEILIFVSMHPMSTMDSFHRSHCFAIKHLLFSFIVRAFLMSWVRSSSIYSSHMRLIVRRDIWFSSSILTRMYWLLHCIFPLTYLC